MTATFKYDRTDSAISVEFWHRPVYNEDHAKSMLERLQAENPDKNLILVKVTE